MQHQNAKINFPASKSIWSGKPKNANDRHAILVENGQLEAVGYLPKNMASWLAPLIDEGKIHLDGYVPERFHGPEKNSRCR